ncbi:histidine phosphatase family protein [Zavarzinia compransoris]|uniref:histidine phosphatase family protein n=1 Tax=Zavarzinia marina TaxID=2911065 RepID=UPI001F242DC8|nr:histidine phosphatase family protein [Zavarzinia marina]MCF4164555.1 histidine phosphatase family protein [Zavarzinia marina]
MSAIDFILIRHGRQSAGFHVDPDPGLDETGEAQARAMAERLTPDEARNLVTSPLRRARATAAAVEVRHGVIARVEPRIAEVPTAGLTLEQRGAWLPGFLHGAWSDQPDHLIAWRRSIGDFFAGIETPGVFVTHFVVVNALIGLATGDDRVSPSLPDHCSINRFRLEAGRVRLIETGAQRETMVG